MVRKWSRFMQEAWMPRPNKPRYRANRDAWVTQINGQLVTLAKGKRNRAEADRELRRLLTAKETGAPPSVAVAELFDRLLKWTQEHRSPLTLEWYDRHLSAFAEHVGPTTACAAVRPLHVARWLEGREIGQATRHGAITAIKRAFRWGHRQGYLDSNPLEGLDRPKMPRREVILTPDQERAVLKAAPPPLRDYLVMIHETGCRPSEVARMEAAHVDGDMVTMRSKTTEATGRARTIYLTAIASEIVRRLSGTNPTGPIFRNSRGRPWTRNARALAMQRIRRKLGLGPECVAESFRHGWVTEAKLHLPNSIVAELAGHTSTSMVDKFYGHVSQRKAELAAAAARIRATRTDTAAPADAPPPGPAPEPPGTTRRKPPGRTPGP
jgi:integrase/recombinase XerC